MAGIENDDTTQASGGSGAAAGAAGKAIKAAGETAAVAGASALTGGVGGAALKTGLMAKKALEEGPEALVEDSAKTIILAIAIPVVFFLFMLILILVVIFGYKINPQTTCPATTAAGGKYTNDQAVQKLKEVNIGVVSSGNCSNKNDPTCTSLD